MSLSCPQDGPTATKEIRALNYCGAVIGVTGNVLQFDVDHFLAHGADRVLGKPLRKQELEIIFSGSYALFRVHFHSLPHKYTQPYT